MKVRSALAGFAAAGGLIVLAGQAIAESPAVEGSPPTVEQASAPTPLPAAELASLPEAARPQAPSPTPGPPPPTPGPPPPQSQPTPEPASEPAPPPEPDPAPEVESAHGAEPAAEPQVAPRPEPAPTVKPSVTSTVDDTDTESAQGDDGFARAPAPVPDLAPLDGGGRLDLSSGAREQPLLSLRQLEDNQRQAQAPGPGGESPIPPLPCQLTNAGLVCAGAENCVLTSGGAICTQDGVPCVVTSAGSQCVPGCALTSAGLVCPSGCTLTSAGIRCPLAGRVLGFQTERRKRTRRRKPTRVLAKTSVRSGNAAPTSVVAHVRPRESAERDTGVDELPFTGARLLWEVAVACLLLAAGVLLARRTSARDG